MYHRKCLIKVTCNLIVLYCMLMAHCTVPIGQCVSIEERGIYHLEYNRTHDGQMIHVAVLCGNRRLFRHIPQSLCCV